jgi:hypothetical protein
MYSQKLKLKNQNTNQERNVPIGYSFTTFFFGLIPSLLRGDIKFAGSYFLGLLIVFFLPFFVLILAPVAAATFNRVHIQNLRSQGYEIVSDSVPESIISELGLRENDVFAISGNEGKHIGLGIILNVLLIVFSVVGFGAAAFA